MSGYSSCGVYIQVSLRGCMLSSAKDTVSYLRVLYLWCMIRCESLELQRPVSGYPSCGECHTL